MSSESGDTFNLEVVYENFNGAQHEEDDVKLDLYLLSFDELNKFFTLIGTIFSFVSKDLEDKMGILRQFLNGEETSSNFQTVKEMIKYEKENELLHKKGYISGSRTLLRLHRGLDFIKLFLKKLSDLNDNDKTSDACRDAYNDTLAKHHPFIIRQGAKVAIYTLPTKEQLLKRVCGANEEHIKKTLDLLPSTLEVTTVIFDRIDKLYTNNDLHTLP